MNVCPILYIPSYSCCRIESESEVYEKETEQEENGINEKDDIRDFTRNKTLLLQYRYLKTRYY
jgi:hypothetical protein